MEKNVTAPKNLEQLNVEITTEPKEEKVKVHTVERGDKLPWNSDLRIGLRTVAPSGYLDKLEGYVLAAEKKDVYRTEPYLLLSIKVTAPALDKHYVETADEMRYTPVTEFVKLSPVGEPMAETNTARTIQDATLRAYEELFSKMPEIDEQYTLSGPVSKLIEDFASSLANNIGRIIDNETLFSKKTNHWFTNEEIAKLQKITSARREQMAKEKWKKEHFTSKTIDYTYSRQG